MKARVIKTGEMVDVYHEPQHGQITNIYKESVLVNGRMWTEDELDFCVKANEAPEKIHIQPNAHDRWFEGAVPNGLPNGLFVEYVRKESIVEKVCEWFNGHFEDIGLEWLRGYNADEVIENFKEYIRGE